MLDRCGICSGGFTNHTANIYLDCKGVCFGNYTTNCDIQLVTHSLEIPVEFDLLSDETALSTTVFINNTSTSVLLCQIAPFFGLFHSYPLIHNAVPPFIYYSLSLLNETDKGEVLVPIEPDSFLFPGHGKLAITLYTTIQALLTSPSQYDRSVRSTQLEVLPAGPSDL